MTIHAGDDSFIQKLEGFDTSAALAAIANKVSLYRTILQQFVSLYADGMPEKLEGLIAENDLKTLTREAHTIKGLAGSLGHPELREAALSLEMACRDEKPVDEIKIHSQAFLNSLQSAVSTIKTALSEKESPTADQIKEHGLQPIADKLYKLLLDDDIYAIEVFEREMAPLISRSNPEIFYEIKRALSDFDFKAARDALDLLRGNPAAAEKTF